MKTIKNKIQLRLLSSLSKVFADEKLSDTEITSGSVLRNEVYSFQLAFHSNELVPDVQVVVKSPLDRFIEIRSVGLAPGELPYISKDAGMIRDTPGLYPDPLYSLGEYGITLFPHQWRAIWVTVRIPQRFKTGNFKIKLSLVRENKTLAKTQFSLNVLKAVSPAQTLIQTQWFHSDCIATHYAIPVLSESWWNWVALYLKNAVDHGINMILTPIFTPPLDTRVGGERPTVQLVQVQKRGAQYQFDFSALKRWFDLGKEVGVEFFEISHLFTQWGAGFAPKIIVREKGTEIKKFGWHTPAMGKEYRNFLSQFLPQLVLFIHQEGLSRQIYFHISDEPTSKHLEAYRQASLFLKKYLSEFPVIDALSDFEFYRSGLVNKPIPSNDHIEPYVKAKVKGLWTYYCVAQWKKVPNRFFNMPSTRNRVMGVLLYKYQIEGFLHWGFNFWYSQFSRYPINPFYNTDAGNRFPSGDSFLVYPGEKAPIDSIRHEVHREGLQDLRALQLLEKTIGRDQVVQLLEKDLKKPLSMEYYPLEISWLLDLRKRINQKINEIHR